MEYPLQPLRIPSGWSVPYNDGLYEVDPDPSKLVGEFDDIECFKEDMLMMVHAAYNRLLDVGWYPTADLAGGSYGLVVYEGDFHGRLLFELETRDRAYLVREIERLLREISAGRR
jgi:hypothetical protein